MERVCTEAAVATVAKLRIWIACMLKKWWYRNVQKKMSSMVVYKDPLVVDLPENFKFDPNFLAHMIRVGTSLIRHLDSGESENENAEKRFLRGGRGGAGGNSVLGAGFMSFVFIA